MGNHSLHKGEFTTTDMVSLEELPNLFDVVAYYRCSMAKGWTENPVIGVCCVLTGKGRDPIYKTFRLDELNLPSAGIMAIGKILGNIRPNQNVAIVGVDEYALRASAGAYKEVKTNLGILQIVNELKDRQASTTFIHVRALSEKNYYLRFALSKAREVLSIP